MKFKVGDIVKIINTEELRGDTCDTSCYECLLQVNGMTNRFMIEAIKKEMDDDRNYKLISMDKKEGCYLHEDDLVLLTWKEILK